jgi:hypothetical protein
MRPLIEDRIRENGEEKREALFEVTSKNPSLKSLHKYLIARDTKQRRPDLGRYALAKELGITANIEGGEKDVDHKIAVSNELNRRLGKAELLIRNVERGRFPDFADYEKPGKLAEPPRALREKATKPKKPALDLQDMDEPTLF